MVLFSGGACVVLFSGGGACVVLFSRGACMVLFSGGGVHGFIQRGGVRGFLSFSGYNEIRSMSGRYASYWNAFLCLMKLKTYSAIKDTVKPVAFSASVHIYNTLNKGTQSMVKAYKVELCFGTCNMVYSDGFQESE